MSRLTHPGGAGRARMVEISICRTMEIGGIKVLANEAGRSGGWRAE